MCKRLFYVFLANALLTVVTWAGPIEVENPSFELPDTGQLAGFENVPGWSTDKHASGSGIGTDIRSTWADSRRWVGIPFFDSVPIQSSTTTRSMPTAMRT